jgi:hypothetical protein
MAGQRASSRVRGQADVRLSLGCTTDLLQQTNPAQPTPQPQKPGPTQCTNGSSPSRVNNSNTGTHMITGGAVGASGGMIVGALVVANVIGFPEVEGGEAAIITILGGAGADSVATGGFIGGMWGGGTGMMVGLVATPPSCGGGAGP